MFEEFECGPSDLCMRSQARSETVRILPVSGGLSSRSRRRAIVQVALLDSLLAHRLMRRCTEFAGLKCCVQEEPQG